MEMDRALNNDWYYWRLVATGFCFAIFAIGGVVLGAVTTTLLPLFIWDQQRRRRFLRFLVHLSFRCFVGLMRVVGVLTYEIHGRDKLSVPGQLVIANHPTLIDVVFLIACIPNGICIVKQNLLESYFVGGLLRRAGYIGNTSQPKAALEACVEALNSGATLIMFPEGSRSIPGTNQRFRRGAAYVALAAHKEFTPVHISCSPSTLTKSERWHDIPKRRIHFVMSVGENIPLEAPDRMISKRVAAKVMTDRAGQLLLKTATAYE